MEFAIISEDLMRSPSQFQCVDNREFLYNTNSYLPISSVNPIKWADDNIPSAYVHPIADNGDICITKDLADIIMSYDPYGIEVYPASLITQDNELSNRYILAINNIQDVADFDRSAIEISPYGGELIIHRLFLSADKLANIPLEKRIIYRVKEADTAVFFTPEIYDLIANDDRFSLLRKMKKNTSVRAPKF
ncbi:hypothetical protein GNP80_20415 [Aliivibrio fischeri]|uniref:hypothetical protein n=1 Tax=Aliivibrio fischeri TaxID=668 RepID=UPI0012DA95AF|nr:hypothetical protein [Aliivibrio fischeri]MUK94778.1 hypothetical protein [Aliivibrio fischeri]